MIKRLTTILCAALMLCVFILTPGCGKNGGEAGETGSPSGEAGETGSPSGEAGDELPGCASYAELADIAIRMAQESDPQLVKKLMPPGAVEFNVNRFAEKDQDYFELLQSDLDSAAAKYTEDAGEGWKLTYKFTECREKDEEGIQNYRDYDEYYFNQYGVDPAKITGAVFIYADVTVSGPNGEFTKEKKLWTFEYEGRWYSLYMLTFGLFVTGK